MQSYLLGKGEKGSLGVRGGRFFRLTTGSTIHFILRLGWGEPLGGRIRRAFRHHPEKVKIDSIRRNAPIRGGGALEEAGFSGAKKRSLQQIEEKLGS